MNIIQAHAVNNLCYITAKKMTPQGIVVHSTGANNPELRRYVDYEQVLGRNKYANHWNTATPGGRKVCVHAFIGYDKNQVVQVAEILPLDICCWGIGRGSKGSYNDDPPYIQFEICEDGLQDRAYYEAAFGTAAQYCAYLCKKFGLTENQIVGHSEAYRQGYGSNHSDPEHWMRNFGENMDDFRQKVGALLTAEKAISTTAGSNTPAVAYWVKITANALNIRKGSGTNTKVVGCIRDKGVYTIVAEANGPGATLWGKLKSGAGWIALDYTKRI